MTSHQAPTQMFRSNVEVVRYIYDAFRRRDLPAALEFVAPDIEIYQSSEVPWGGEYRGREGMQALMSKLVTNVQSAVSLERFIDAGDDIVAIGRTEGTALATGEAFVVPVAHVWTLREGLAVRVRYFIDNPTMLAALP
jgi:ketosteroid isomerase-like protein